MVADIAVVLGGFGDAFKNSVQTVSIFKKESFFSLLWFGLTVVDFPSFHHLFFVVPLLSSYPFSLRLA